jgi:cell division septal protein FtsQ
MELTPKPNSAPSSGNKAPSGGSSPPERFLRGRTRRSRPTRRIGKLLIRSFMLLLGVATLTAALAWTVTAFGQAPELKVDRVVVEGNEQLSDGEILELLGLSERANILTLDLEKVRMRLLRSAWVREVEIERILPSTLKLEIRERRPVAVAVLDELYLLASDGTMLDQLSPRYDIERLVLARGIRNAEGLVPGRAALAGRLAAELGRHERLLSLVSELDVSEGRDSVRLRLRAPAVTALVHGDNMVERLSELVPLLHGIQRRYAGLDVVDLRFEGRAYLRLKDQPDATGTTGSGGRATYAQAALATGGAPF